MAAYLPSSPIGRFLRDLQACSGRLDVAGRLQRETVIADGNHALGLIELHRVLVCRHGSEIEPQCLVAGRFDPGTLAFNAMGASSATSFP